MGEKNKLPQWLMLLSLTLLASGCARKQANWLPEQACTSGDPEAARRGASATRAAVVLSELFQRADKRAGELAKAYDAARIAGLACERSYKSVGVPKQCCGTLN